MDSKDKQPDGVEAYPADKHDLDSYQQAQSNLDLMRIPLLLHSDNQHERVFLAALDGTGNSMFDDDPENWSVVAKIYKQIEERKSSNISSGYVEGTFTQEGLLRTPERLWDGRYGHTFGQRVETSYYQICEQTRRWLKEDTQAQVRVVGIGFSRGSEEVAALERMIEERGIRDPADANVKFHDRLITQIAYADKPLLVQPGKTIQVALLFDPVATGVEEHDRRLPPSTVSTFQITAEDERRNLFKSDDHIPFGFSEGDRNFNVVVGGAHSDIGNTYNENGLGVLSQNLGVEFLNRLSDRDYLQKQTLPIDPAMYVVHRSDQGMFGLYGTSAYDKDGLRDHVNQLAPAALCKNEPAIACRRKDPISPELEGQLERRTGPNVPLLEHSLEGLDRLLMPVQTLEPAASSKAWNPLFLQMTDAALRSDAQGIHAAGRFYSESSGGQSWLGQGRESNQALLQQTEQERQQALQLVVANEAQVQRAPVMRL